jgi:hypothetical protein
MVLAGSVQLEMSAVLLEYLLPFCMVQRYRLSCFMHPVAKNSCPPTAFAGVPCAVYVQHHALDAVKAPCFAVFDVMMQVLFGRRLSPSRCACWMSVLGRS